MPMRTSIVCVMSSVDRMLERDVARREPHLLVAGFFFPSGFVARVRLEQTALQVRDRGAVDALVEVLLHVVDDDRRGSSSRTLRPCRCASAR